MNKIWSKVWSKTLGAFVVASELAKGRGAATKCTVVASVSMILGIASAMVTMPAAGQAVDPPPVFYTDASRTAVMLGDGTTPVKVGNVAAGTEATDAVNKAQLDAVTDATATAAHLFAADGATDGSEDALALGSHAVAAGANSFATGEESATYGYGSAASGSRGVAIGAGSGALSDNTVAVGWGANAASSNGTALGYGSGAQADNSVALGANTQANGVNSVALGANAQADRANTVSVGNTQTGETRQIVNVADGTAATDAVSKAQLDTLAARTAKATHLFAANGATDGSEDAMAQGAYAVAAGAKSIVFGSEGVAYGYSSIAWGANGTAFGARSLAFGEGTTAVGRSAAAMGGYGAAFGNSSVALGLNSTALGSRSVARGEGSASVGYGSAALAANSVALGANARADRANTVSVGSVETGETRQIVNVGAGTEATDAVNKGQLDETNAAVAQNTAAIGTINDTAVFYTDVSRTAVTLGDGMTPVKVGNVAAGTEATDAVNKVQLDAVTDATATATHLFAADGATDGSEDALALGTHAVAAGANSFATGEESATYGYGAAANGSRGVAIGAGSGALSDNTVAVGWGANAASSNGTALGYGSGAQADNSVALGANSQADRANSVSVGSRGQERQIVNVADGTAATDAVNKGQLDAVTYAMAKATHLFAANGALDGSEDAMALAEHSVAVGAKSYALGSEGSAYGYNSIAWGANGTALGARSLAFAANSTAVGASAAGVGEYGAAFGNSSVAWGLNSTALGSRSLAQGAGSASVGYGSVAQAANSVALGVNALADRADTVSVGNAQTGETRQIANVAAGTEATDAVNKGQLDALAAQAGETDEIAVKYDDAGKGTVTLAGAGGTVLANVADGEVSATSKQAVNGSQLNATNDAVAQNTSNIATNTASIGTINNTAVFYTDASRTVVTLGDGATPVKVGNVAAGTDATDAVNKSQLDALAAQAGQTDASAVKYDDASKDQITLGGSSGSRISHLQASDVSDDAATVGQVDGLLKAIGGGADLQAGGLVSMPVFNVQGGSYSNVGDALGAMDGVLTGALSSIAGLDGRLLTLEQTPPGHGPGVAVDGPDDARVTEGSKGVAVGSGATAGGDHGTAIGGDSYAAGPNDTAIGGNAKVRADGSTAVGANTTIAAAATNAVAVGESASVTEASGTAIGQGSSVTAVGAVALGQGSVAVRANTVSVGTAAHNRQITNVAAGTQATDVANLGQVQEALVTAKSYTDASSRQTLQSANAYTDQKLSSFASTSDVNSLRDQVNNRFHAMDKRVNQVGAMGTAMAQMAFSTQGINTANRLGVGVGGYHGQAALSVGYSRQLSSRANLTFGAAVSGNEASGGVGVGFGW